MPGFRGYSYHTIDNKGRIIIPSRFRDIIRANGGDGVIVTRMDGCLLGYPFDEWSRLETNIGSMAETSGNIRKFRRVFIGSASECNCDKQDRILIPQALREYAQLEKEIVLVGVVDHFEIWRRENWDSESAEFDEDMKSEEARNEIARLGI